LIVLSTHKEALAFLSALFIPYAVSDELRIEIRPLYPAWKKARLYPAGDAPFNWQSRTPYGTREWFPLTAEGLADATRHAVTLAARYEVYVGVLPRIGRTGKQADVPWSTWLWCDVDGGDAGPNACIDHLAAVCNAGKLPMPHMAVQSGGGLHVYWQLAQAVPLADSLARDRFKRLLQRITQIIGGNDDGVHADSAAAEVARVLRVPGTFNHKRRHEPRPVRIRHDDLSGTRYTFAEWEAFTHTAAPTPPRPEQRIEPHTPDEYARFLRWAQQGYPEGRRHQQLAGAAAWLIRDCGVPKSIARELLLLKAQASPGVRRITPVEVEELIAWA
jgi:hypothetical protein